MSTTLSADALALCELKSEEWQVLRAYNSGEVDVRQVEARFDHLNRACEAFRSKHFPKASEVFAIGDREIGQPFEVYRRTPTGLARLVWAEDAA